MPRLKRMVVLLVLTLLVGGAIPANATNHYVNDGVNKPIIVELTTAGGLIAEALFSVKLRYDPIGWSNPPDAIWIKSSFYCESNGELVGPLFAQNASNSPVAETRLAQNEEFYSQVESTYAVFTEDYGDCDTYVWPSGTRDYFNVVVRVDVVGYEQSGQLIRDIPASWEPAMSYENSFAFLSACQRTPCDPPPDPIGGPDCVFDDVCEGSTFYDEISWLFDSGITAGCSEFNYCPLDPVTRGQMAVFIDRWLNLPDQSGADSFTDDDGHFAEAAIESLVAAGITQGIGAGQFGPNQAVTRGEMALFLTRALDLPARPGADSFTDDDGHFAEAAIESLVAAGITQGIGAGQFGPNQAVTREQMAAFIFRAENWHLANP